MALHTYKTTELTGVTRNRGFALITSLIFLLVLTIIGVTMFGRVTRQQHMAGNIQQKVMALSAASYASQVARYQLDTTSIALSSSCNARTSLQIETVRVCEDKLDYPVADATWNVKDGSSLGVQIADADFNGDVAAAAGTEHAYADYPQYYMQRVSGSGSLQTGGVQSQNKKNFVYRITAWGVGGNAGAVAVTRTLYVP